ncbi:MAG TPA: archaeosine biosynthesis radical SAM protein RaSEA [Methanoregulaceae archaeon]|nr:archaeosine biosynthesis radical SAM protein RaSEA [Methanoregulaceae archaeon]
MSPKSPDSPLASWTGKDQFGGEVIPTLTVILKTAGCSWNRCRMCSYRHERFGEMSESQSESLLNKQLRWIAANHSLDDIEMVKIFTSGSFFDPREVPKAAFQEAGRLFSGKIVIAETRPEFVRRERVSEFVSLIDTGCHDTPLYVAMGLETTDDFIREKCIDKGFSMADFSDAVREASLGGAGTKAYLLMKPLFLTEREAIGDMMSSISAIAGKVEMISMNPCTVQRNTQLEWYWKQGAYRPPYLWSVLKVLRDAPVHVSCDPVGGGHTRGPHNCRSCDYEIVKGIRDYSLSGDSSLLDGLCDIQCDCKCEWEFVVSDEQPYAMPLTR